MKRGLADKAAIVTGAGRGIGRAIAVALAREGAAVALVSRTGRELEETGALIASSGGRAEVYPGDVTDRHGVESIVRQVVGRFGRLDVLCNNAGAHTEVGPVGEDDPERWWSDVSVNLRGTYLFCHYAIPHMTAPGCIVNTASGAGIKPSPHSSAYGCAKAALIMFTESLARELEPRGIAAFSIRPGAVRTAIIKILYTPRARKYLPDAAALFEDGAPLLSPPERAAELVVRLCNPESFVLSGRFITVLDDIDALISDAERIGKEQLHVLRVHNRSGTLS